MTRTRLVAAALLAAIPASAQQRRDADLLVRGGHVVTMDAGRRVFADGAVAVAGGAIVAVGPAADLGARFRAREVLDAGDGIVLPGLINAHTHAPMVLFRGIADDLRLMEWLVAHCPQSNMKTAAGAAPVREMLAEGLRLGLGTDGAASNNDLDMFEEMLSAALLAKLTTGDPTAAPARAVLEMATLGGARALALEDRLGSLEPGKRADLIVVGLASERLHPLYDPVSHLVYAAKGSDVRHVVIDGRVVMRDRRVLTLDGRKVLAEAERFRAQVAAALPR